MKLGLMVHQFGTLGEERGRLPVMNVLFGHYCTQTQIPAFHTPAHLIGPWLVGAVTAMATWCQRSTRGKQPRQPLPDSETHSVSGCLVETVTDQNQACFFFFTDNCCMFRWSMFGDTWLVLIVLYLTLLFRLAVRAFFWTIGQNIIWLPLNIDLL